jgi:hypothetical protein
VLVPACCVLQEAKEAQKAAGRAAAAMVVMEADLSTQDRPAPLPRKPRKAPSVSTPAVGTINPMGGAAGQQASGKRVRVPSAKGAELLAMQSDAAHGRRQRGRLTQYHWLWVL